MILCIVGPTGVGKTKLSIQLAKKYQGIIINGDAVQVYQELNIGSAKIKESEKEGIDHYLLDMVSPNEQYTVYDYQKDVRKVLEEHTDKTIIIVGGSGLYLKSALYDYQFLEEEEKNTFDNLSNEEIYQMALKKDSNCTIHPNNRKRLIRFLNQKKTCTNSAPMYSAIYIGLTTSRDILYEKINLRVDAMLKDGLVEETKYLTNKYKDAAILNNAIGYKEIKKYLNKEMDYETSVSEIKKNSRHYAKRQYTFFKNQLPVKWFIVDYENFNRTVEKIITYIESKKDSGTHEVVI